MIRATQSIDRTRNQFSRRFGPQNERAELFRSLRRIATAAALAIDGRVTVQEVDYAKLRERLLADKQVLSSALKR